MRGFSLIELIVVIAIIAILSSIAAPIYIQYQERAKVIAVYDIVKELLEEQHAIYATTGKFPISFKYQGYQINSGAWTFFSTPYPSDIKQMGSHIYTNGMFVQAVVNSIETPAHPVNGVTIGVYDDGNAATYACGLLSNDTAYEVPANLMPPNCTCHSVATFVLTGSGC